MAPWGPRCVGDGGEEGGGEAVPLGPGWEEGLGPHLQSWLSLSSL